MKTLFASALILLAVAAHAAKWDPGREQIPLYPDAAPGADKEDTALVDLSTWNVAGKPWLKVQNVSQPTLTVFPPRGKNTGASLVVFPGGGYNILAIDLEGTEICDWVTSRGMTCALLKYRVPCKKIGPYRDCPTALADAQRAVALFRERAANFSIDPHRIGVIGFSAGGHMVAAISTHFDAASRPDFAVALYPGHLAVPERRFVLNPDIKPTKQTPPTLLIQAQDDPVDPIENSLRYYDALQKAGVPAELHVFAKGRHAFGLRKTDLPVTDWPRLAESWMTSIGMLPR